MQAEAKENLYFDEFRLEVPKRRLFRNDEHIQLNPKAFDLLLVLAENSGRLLSKDDLFRFVWHGRIVEESNLSVRMAQIRKALGETAKEPRYITTISGEGYRFAAEVHTGEFSEEIIEQRSFARIVIEEDDGSLSSIRPVASKPLASTGINFRNRRVAVAAGLIVFLGLAFGGYYFKTRFVGGTIAHPPGLDIRRLTSTGNVSAVAMAADGRFMVFAQRDVEGDSLWLRQIETGSQTRITQPRKAEYMGLSISPDGNYVYASVYLENRADTPVWKIPILGGVPEEVPDVVTASAVAFSPDGRQIAYTESHRPETHLYVADASGENSKLVVRAHSDNRVLPFEQCSPVAWSPDGQTIALVFHEKRANASPSGILLVNPADGSERILVSPRWAYVDYVTWLDSETIVFTGWDDEWTNQIWTVSRRDGEARQITSGIQRYRWLAARDGKLLTAQVNEVSSLYRADFVETAESLSPREILRESGNAFYLATNNTNAIFYSSRATGKSEVWRINEDASDPMQITSSADVVYGLAISPMDNSLIFPSTRDGGLRLWAVNADGGNVRQLAKDAVPMYPDIAADGTVVFQDGDYSVARLSPGETQPVQLGKGLKPAISIDGKQVAFFTMNRGKWSVRIADATSGEVLKDLELPTNIKERRMRWHPSGKFLGLVYDAGERLLLLILPTDGSQPRIIDNLGNGVINTFTWSSDGKHLLFSVTNKTEDAVLISGF